MRENSDLFSTQKISFIQKDRKSRLRSIILEVERALSEKGYDPSIQIAGYILSSDPTYITSHNNARKLIAALDRDDLLEELISFYLEKNL